MSTRATRPPHLKAASNPLELPKLGCPPRPTPAASAPGAAVECLLSGLMLRTDPDPFETFTSEDSNDKVGLNAAVRNVRFQSARAGSEKFDFEQVSLASKGECCGYGDQRC